MKAVFLFPISWNLYIRWWKIFANIPFVWFLLFVIFLEKCNWVASPNEKSASRCIGWEEKWLERKNNNQHSLTMSSPFFSFLLYLFFSLSRSLFLFTALWLCPLSASLVFPLSLLCLIFLPHSRTKRENALLCFTTKARRDTEKSYLANELDLPLWILTTFRVVLWKKKNYSSKLIIHCFTLLLISIIHSHWEVLILYNCLLEISEKRVHQNAKNFWHFLKTKLERNSQQFNSFSSIMIFGTSCTCSGIHQLC